ncbi:MAG: GspH/FimT family pseudopilin [Gallionella sp.]|nr:GspH/FimT family pseudopilin [Gallionella sp.]
MYGYKYILVLEMNSSRSLRSGFTLIELMVTIALVAILLAVAVPSLTAFLRNSELTSFSNSMLASLNAARGEAMKRGRYAMATPTDGTNWDSGWVVFVDVDRSQNYAAANDITIMTKEAKPNYLTLTPKTGSSAADSPPYIMFDASGYSKLKSGGFGAVTFTIARNDAGASDFAQIRRIVIASTGRVKACTPVSASDTNCPD